MLASIGQFFSFNPVTAATNDESSARSHRAQAQAEQAGPDDLVIHSAASGGRLADLLAKAETSGSVRVIVGVRAAFQPEGTLQAPDEAQTQRAAIASAQESLLSRMSAFAVSDIKKFQTIPFLAMEVDLQGLQYLRSSPEVTTIEEDALHHTTLAESVPLIGAPPAWANGFAGAGQVVAILDTGVDKTHPFLAGKVVSEACYSTNSATTSSVCPAGVSQSTDVGSGVNCTAAGCEHGTHVAGIAAGKSASFSGVARDANIIAIDVFSRVTNCTSTVDCTTAFTSDILLGLQQVQQLSSSFKIAAVNLSLGGSGSPINCDATRTAFKAAIDNLRSIGIATVVASGNDGNPGGISSPACISSAISVGSTGDGSNGSTADAVSTFSNSASFLGLLAPGEWINSSVPGGTFKNFRGTSQATPHVTGTWAVLKSKTTSASVSQVFQSLTSTGMSIIDPRNQIAKPRIRVDAAVAALPATSCSYTIAPSTQPIAQEGGTGTLTVTAGSGCAWTAHSDVPWLTITSGGSGTGDGSVSYSAVGNSSLDRAGTLSIAGQLFIVTQPGAPLLAVDDGGFEVSSGLTFGGSSYRVNRLTPTSYPTTINAVAIYFASGVGVNVGDHLTILAATNPSGSSVIDGIHFQTTPATVQSLDQFNVYPIQGLAVSSGDFVVGMQISHAPGVFPFSIDTTPPSRRRSYRSTDGTTFRIIDDVGTAGNYGIRAIVSQTLACPTIANLSPSNALSGSASAITITGTGFAATAAVAFTNNVAAPFIVNSDTQITTTLPDGAESGPITISKPNCASTQTPSFVVTPCTAVSPTSQLFDTAGGSGIVTVTAAGSCNWTARSSVPWLTITSGGSGNGNGTVGYAVAANATGKGRIGVLTVGGAPFAVVQPVSGAFTTTNGLVTARDGHTATLLQNGKVLIIGGEASGGGVLASAELYNPAAGTFAATGSMAVARENHKVTLLQNGKVLIVGGFNSSAGVLSSAELYDPIAGTFSATGSLSTARYFDAAVLLKNGKVLVTGGTNFATSYIPSAELYDPAIGIFSLTGSPFSPRRFPSATLLQNGKVLVVGGYGPSGELASAELYDPATGMFSPTGSLATARDSHTATLLQNGKVLIVGGRNASGIYLTSAELYDPATGTFSSTGHLATARMDPTVTLLQDGKVLVIGGYSSGSLSSAELYDPATGAFSPTGSLNTGRESHSATLLQDGKVLVVGGYNGSSLSSAELYDATNKGRRRTVSP